MSVVTTNGIRIAVVPKYMAAQSNPMAQQWLWSYQVTISNETKRSVRLLTRHWIIVDANGKEEHVEGVGVVGETPLIEPGQAHVYSSFCPLRTPFGTMRGSYGMVTEDGDAFRADVAVFTLVTPQAVN